MAIFDKIKPLIMKVYLTSTPEFSSEKLDEVIALLQGIPGELEFDKKDSFTQVQYKRLNPRFKDIEGIDSLTFDEYFDLVQGYREFQQEIKDEDFVILITSIRHDRNWFSGFNNRNIFVRGDEWDIISDVDSKFGIAYQCVENIFQSLMGLDIMNYKKEPNIHKETKACINDFCANKTDIIMKFQSGTICNSCLDVAEFEKGVDKYIFIHIIEIIEEIRKEFVVSRHLRSITKLEKVKVDSDGKISIGDRKLKLATMPRVLYLGFLKQIGGIPNNQLCEHKNLFDEIYKLVKKKNRGEYSIEKMLCKQITYERRVDKQTPTFETNRTRIKEGLIECLGVSIANYYAVNLVEDDDYKMSFKVNLSQDHIDLSPPFK
jgi:hypothetical protein